MHVAAMNPQYVSPAQVPAEFVAKEKEIALAQMSDKDKAKPAAIQEKMIRGKVNTTLAEISMTGQSYVLDTNVTDPTALKAAKAQVHGFVRPAVDEDSDKQQEEFAPTG